MIYIGIDPGEVDGAIAIFEIVRDCGIGDIFHQSIQIYDCPKTHQEMKGLFQDFYPGKVRVAIEKASKTIHIGKKTYHATTVLWGNYQAWLMACVCLGFKHEIVPPRKWQSKICDGNKKLSTKVRAWEAACRLYPEAIPLLKGKRGAKKFGRSDAVCIMEWARRNL